MTKDYIKLAQFLYEIGTLRKIARSHRQTLLTDDLSDNIAAHSFRVAMIGWFLAKIKKADPYKVVMMCLLHDTSETRTGDQNWVHKKFVKAFEDEAIASQFSQLIGEEELLKHADEYSKRLTIEAKLAKDADLLDQVLLLKEYAWSGNQEAQLWLKDNQQIKYMSSEQAKLMARQIISQRPGDWWKGIWSVDRRK